MMTRSLCYVSTEVRDLHIYDGLNKLDTFLDAFEKQVLEKQCFHALDWVLRAMPVRWRGMQKGSFIDWHKCRRMMRIRFGKPKVRLTEKYNGHDNLRAHLAGRRHMEKSDNLNGAPVLSYPRCYTDELVYRNRASPWDR